LLDNVVYCCRAAQLTSYLAAAISGFAYQQRAVLPAASHSCEHDLSAEDGASQQWRFSSYTDATLTGRIKLIINNTASSCQQPIRKQLTCNCNAVCCRTSNSSTSSHIFTQP
jgi:hypothetical protein